MAKNKKKENKDYKKYKDMSDKKLEKLKEEAKKKNKTIVLGRKGKQSKPQYADSYDEKGDRKKKALPPGKRISKNGRVYYAYRKDHTDRTLRKV